MILSDYSYFKKIVLKRLGIDLDMSDEQRNIGKMNLFLKSLEITKSLEAYHLSLSLESDQEIFFKKLTNIVTINETSFFRDKMPFDYIKSILGNYRHAEVLSIPCSTGQEAYSLAILFEENGVRNYHISGVDICENVIEYAKTANYNSFEMTRGIPDALREKYFLLKSDGFEVVPKVRYKVDFSVGSALTYQSNIGEEKDIIFCRNLLIYFNDKTRVQVLGNLINCMKIGGKLILGAGERIEHPSLSVDNYLGMPIYTKK